MDPISSSDRLVALLRQRLLERSKASASGRSGKAAGRAPATPGAVHALAGIGEVEDRQLRRALIQNILADQLGPELLNEASFHQVVDRVVETLEEDEAGSALLSRMVRELRPDG
jgi:hypothetical protein